MEINDLINLAIINAVTRRESIETEQALLTLSDQEAATIAGGLETVESAKTGILKPDITIAGFKPINPIKPPVKPPVKPICPPIIVGLIAVDTDKLA